MITIVFSAGPHAGQRIELDREKTFGRAGCDVILDDPEVSRRHLVLRPTDAGVQVEDLGSSNGTLVDGQRIAEAVSVGHGGAIRLGASALTVEVPAAQQAPEPTMPASAPTAARPVAPTPAAPTPAAPTPAMPAGAAASVAGGGLPGWFWTVTAVVELAVIVTAAAMLVHYAV